MKVLKFRQSLINEILEGRKTSTWRLFDEKDLKIGDNLEFVCWETGEKFANADIIDIREKKLQEVEDNDFEGHEKFLNKEEMYETYKIIMGKRLIKILL